ncbi:MAG: SMP-30/gluconolactonase/LRE family protein [Caulobacteraceae bacterium]|nr:SMP-30/gluconolactonase/LRE family protein [Caulobacteraceae bacterium]
MNASCGPIRVVAPASDRCGEAATWSAGEGALYWSDVNRFLVHRLAPDGGVRTWLFDEPVVALSLTQEEGVLLVALASRLLLWRWRTDERRDHGFRLAGWPAARLNDGRAAPDGDLWIGSMGNNVGPHGEALAPVAGLGVLHRLRAGEDAAMLKAGIGISNTVCWSPDRRTFYFGDTLANVIWAFDYDEITGDIGNERPFFAGFARGAPDGSAVDAEGALWNCRFGAGCLVRVLADGRIDEVVEVPARNPTTCAFGGENLRTLFITTAAMMTDESERLAGSLLATTVVTPGLDGFRARV